MRFYQFKSEVKKDGRLGERKEVAEERARNSGFADGAGEFNENAPKGVGCFLFGIRETSVSGCAALPGAQPPEKTVKAFLEALGLHAQKTQTEEITLRSFLSRTRTAERQRLLNGGDSFIEACGLDLLAENRYPYLEYREKMISPGADEAASSREAQALYCGETFLPELERIFAGKKTGRAYGHPVHYMIETDLAAQSEKMLELLLSALLCRGRLQSRKVSVVDALAEDGVDEEKYGLLYRCSEGGAVAVRLDRSEQEDDSYAESAADTIEKVCAAALRYRRTVLTVFLLPRACEGLKKKLFEGAGALSFVELREDFLSGAGAQACLKQAAKELGLRADKALLQAAEPEKTYLPRELHALAEAWFERKLKTGVYPQYGAFAPSRNTAAKAAPRGSAWDELQEMIGLADAKKVIGKALDSYKLQRICKDMGVPQDRPAMHMVFTGSPGTAKTTAARLFARIMRENGLLSSGHLVEVGRSDLVAKYVGWTAKTVKEKFKAAKGGVLFIDEAYSLVDDRGGSFGDEAINTIVQEMENQREDLVVIFAGYPDEMERFLEKNPGLRSRIAFHVPFADYSAAELCAIAKLIGKQKGVSFSEDAVEKLHTVFEAARLQPDFGNGRYARNVVEQAKMNMASRLLAMDPDSFTKETLTTVEAADIELPTVKKTVKTNVIGFCA